MFSISIFQINSLLDTVAESEIASTQQCVMETEIMDDAPVTKISYVGNSTNDYFSKYRIIHETQQEINGIYQRKPIKYYIYSDEIELYWVKNSNYIIAKGKAALVKEAFARLEKSNIIKLTRYNVNLAKLKEEAKDAIVTGAWFKNLNVSKVESAAVFGSKVSESKMWSELEDGGTMSSLLLQIAASINLSFMVSSEASILFYRKWIENQCLDLAYAVLEFLKPYLVEVEVK